MPVAYLKMAYRFATFLILGGFALLCQPFWMSLFTYGFPILLIGVILFMILDHIPPKQSEQQETGNA